VAAIEPEGHFLKVGGEMFCRNPMPRSHDAPLQKREGRFDCVGMDFAVHIDFGFVFDGLVAGGEAGCLHCRGIGVEFIGHDHVNIFAHIVLDVLRQRPTFRIVGMKEAGFAAALPESNHDLLFALGMPWLVLMAALDSADIGFIHLDRSIKHRLFRRRHCRANPMAEIPRRLVADPERPLNLIGAHPLARLAEQVNGGEPLDEWQMGVMEDAVRRDRELIIAVFAIENFGCVDESRDQPFATRAFGLVRPAQTLKKFTAKIVIGERVAKLDNGHRRFLCG